MLDESNREVLRAQINMELAGIKRDFSGPTYLGNFFDKIYNPNSPNGGRARNFIKTHDMWKKSAAGTEEETNNLLSEKFKNRYHGELFDDIDAIVDRLELKSKIEELLNQIQALYETTKDKNGRTGRLSKDQSEKKSKITRQLEEVLEPVYVELRLMGYSHEDLAK
jgi:hypothetical protein